MSQIPVYHQHFFPFNGKTHGDVHGQETLSATRIKGGYYKYLLLGVLVFIKSTLERSTRKASLIMFRLLSSTTITCSGDLLFFSCYWDITVFHLNRAHSGFQIFLPRTLVFIFSCIKIITAGTKSPRTRATNKMFSYSVPLVRHCHVEL